MLDQLMTVRRACMMYFNRWERIVPLLLVVLATLAAWTHQQIHFPEHNDPNVQINIVPIDLAAKRVKYYISF